MATAIDFFNTLLDADCLATVGWSKFHLGETIEAEQLLLKSLSVEPLVASTHHYLAYIAIFKQDIALAR
ncbi:MAG: hypothetical protein ABSA33_02830, partial [Candidatus Micrarchaeaceae archaeon]